MDSERSEAKAARRAQRPSLSRARGAFILAILALAAAFAPIAQGQEVRRAKPLTEMDLVFAERQETLKQEKQRMELNKAEQRAIGAAIARLNAQAAYIKSMPTSEYKIQAWDRLLAEQDRVSDWQDRVSRRMDNDQAWADQNEISYQNQLAAASKRQADSSAQPSIDFQPLVPQPKNDCLIVATETYARLKKTAPWARIAGFGYASNTRNAPGHAVVLYEPTQGSTVWLYDEAGSRDLGIKSHDLSELKEAISRWLPGDARVSDIRWIGEERELSYEEVMKQPPLSEKDQTLIAILILVVTYWIFVVVVCFLKGKPGFAAAGIVCSVFALVGAVRIAKPNSLWSRRYYSPEKMNIAHQRFTPLYKEENKRTMKMVIAREWLTFVVLLVVGLTIVPLVLMAIFTKEVKLAMLPSFYEALFSRRDWAIAWLVALAPYIILSAWSSLVWTVKTAKGR